MHIIGSSFIFNIFLVPRSVPNRHQTNSFFFIYLTFYSRHRISPHSPITNCVFINIIALRHTGLGTHDSLAQDSRSEPGYLSFSPAPQWLAPSTDTTPPYCAIPPRYSSPLYYLTRWWPGSRGKPADLLKIGALCLVFLCSFLAAGNGSAGSPISKHVVGAVRGPPHHMRGDHEDRGDDSPQPNEAVKKSMNEQKHIAPRRKGAEARKKTNQLFISNLRASASLRQIVYFFTASPVWARMCPSGGLNNWRG